jgi:KDO2-lipid IV(A) lauroyltransferase
VYGGLLGAAWLSRFSTFEERTHANLELAYGPELAAAERAAIAAGVRRHSARLTYEWLQLASLRTGREAWLAERVEVDDSIEILRSELARGRGAIVVTAHIGNWELLAATLRRVGFDGAVVGYEKRRDSSAAWLIEMRRAYGVETIPQQSHPRALVRVLEEGRILGLLCDLEVRRLAGEFLDFFGTPALTMTAPAALARARQTPLVPVRCVLPREGAPRYVLRVEDPLAYDARLPRREATRDLMQRVNDVFVAWIRESPTQWAWHQPRWRTRPGELEARPLAGR